MFISQLVEAFAAANFDRRRLASRMTTDKDIKHLCEVLLDSAECAGLATRDKTSPDDVGLAYDVRYYKEVEEQICQRMDGEQSNCVTTALQTFIRDRRDAAEKDLKRYNEGKPW